MPKPRADGSPFHARGGAASRERWCHPFLTRRAPSIPHQPVPHQQRALTQSSRSVQWPQQRSGMAHLQSCAVSTAGRGAPAQAGKRVDGGLRRLSAAAGGERFFGGPRSRMGRCCQLSFVWRGTSRGRSHQQARRVQAAPPTGAPRGGKCPDLLSQLYRMNTHGMCRRRVSKDPHGARFSRSHIAARSRALPRDRRDNNTTSTAGRKHKHIHTHTSTWPPRSHHDRDVIVHKSRQWHTR